MSIVITPIELPNGRVSVPYSCQLTAVGGVPPYCWSGTPTASLTISASTGIISGTPDAITNGSFIIYAQDSQSPSVSGHIYLSIVIESRPLKIITNPILPRIKCGEDFCDEIDTIGGQGSIIYYAAPDSLPKGLYLSKSGAFSGKVIQPTKSSCLITASDDYGNTVSSDFYFDFYSSLEILDNALPTKSVGDHVDICIHADGGCLPYAFDVVSGNLPGGLSMDSGGVIKGKCSCKIVSVFKIRVIDSVGTVVTKNISLAVGDPIQLTQNHWRFSFVFGDSCIFWLQAIGGFPPYHYFNSEKATFKMEIKPNGEVRAGGYGLIQTFINVKDSRNSSFDLPISLYCTYL